VTKCHIIKLKVKREKIRRKKPWQGGGGLKNLRFAGVSVVARVGATLYSNICNNFFCGH